MGGQGGPKGALKGIKNGKKGLKWHPKSTQRPQNLSNGAFEKFAPGTSYMNLKG